MAPNVPDRDWQHPAFEVAVDHALVRDPARDVVLRVLAPVADPDLDLLIRFTRTDVVEGSAEEFEGRYEVLIASAVVWEFKDASRGGTRWNQDPRTPNVSTFRDVPLGTVIAAAAKYVEAKRAASGSKATALLDQDLELARVLRGTRTRRGEFLAAVSRLAIVAAGRNPTAPVSALAELLEVDPRQARRWISEARAAGRKER